VRTQFVQPCTGTANFKGERDVDEVTGHRNVVRRLRLHVLDQLFKVIAAHDFRTVALPVQITEQTL
jgi:hypothetical protein